MATLNRTITQSADDAQDINGTVTTNGNALNANGALQYIGLRFQNITIPPGAIINSATLDLSLVSGSFDDPDVTIYCDDTDNAVAFTTTNNDISNRNRTTAGVVWNASGIGMGVKTSPDFKAAVQEVIDRGGWSSGNAIALIIKGNSSSSFFRIEGYDSSGTPAALNIDYTVVSPVTVALDTLSAAASAVSLAVVPGAVSTLLDTLSAALAVQNLIVVPGGVAVVLTTLELDAGAVDLSVVPGETFIALETLAGALSAVQFVVTVDGTDVAVVLASLPLMASTVSLDVVPGEVTVDLATLALLLSAVGVEISTEVLPQIIALSTLSLTAETPSLAVVPGEVAIELQTLALNLTLVDLTVFLMLGCALAADRRRYGAIAADGLRWYATASDRDGCA